MKFFSENKADARKEALARRASILESAAYDYAYDLRRLPAQLSQYLHKTSPKVIALYLPFRGELDPLPALTYWLKQNPDTSVLLCTPRVEGEDLHFYQLKPRFFIDPRCQGEFCEAGFAGILEPKTTLERVAASTIDCFLIPGLAFDQRGYRLGYGRGFYDRALIGARPEASKVGISYDELFVPSLPHENHDIRMDTLITPSSCFDFEV